MDDGAFEAAVEAVVRGDEDGLRAMLEARPELARARSRRAHGAALLHYTAANGVEDERQRTPGNVARVARMLLEAGAEVDAEAEAYGGRATALELAATSVHPERAGVQIELLEVLAGHGARIGPGLVTACLRNGRKAAAEWAARRVGELDFEGACGVGRMDVVEKYFAGGRRPGAEEMRCGFAWACEFGRTEVARALLERGMDGKARLPHHGQTGLHWAAMGGHVETARMLMERGAEVNARDETFGGTALDWVLHGWREAEEKREGYYETARMLARAGAEINPRWMSAEAGLDERMKAELGSGAAGGG